MTRQLAIEKTKRNRDIKNRILGFLVGVSKLVVDRRGALFLLQLFSEKKIAYKFDAIGNEEAVLRQ